MRRQASRHAATRPLRLEGLEPRRVLATFVVTNLLDDGPGSLRDAITQANAAESHDRIFFSVTGVIPLESQLPTITDSVSINGPGRDLLTLDAGNGADGEFATGDGFRIFQLNDGDSSNQLDVALGGLTLTGGDVSGNGGAIDNREILTVVESLLTGNAATVDGGAIYNVHQHGEATVIGTTLTGNAAGDEGGAIFSRALLTVTGSDVSDNTAATLGGGLFNFEGMITVVESTVSVNTAGGDGGGVFSFGGYADVTGSTLSGNASGDNGGGLFTSAGSISNSTFSGNVAVDDGGGIAVVGTTTIVSTTITNNQAQAGGGVAATDSFVAGRDVRTRVSSTIIAGNTATSVDHGNDVALFGGVNFTRVPFGSLGNNLIGDGEYRGVTFFADGELGDQAGTRTMPLAPLLGELSDNGGPTLTHALLPNSSAVNSGGDGYAAGVLGLRPVHYWRLNEITGFVVDDYGSEGRDGDYIASFDLTTPGAVGGGTGLGLDGTWGYADIDSARRPSSFTASVWARSNASVWATLGDVLNAYGTGGTFFGENGFVIRPVRGSTAWQGLIADSSGELHTIGGPGAMHDVGDVSEWGHYAISYDNATGAAKMYFNGEAVVEDTLAADLRPLLFRQGTLDLGFDESAPEARYLDGAIDEVAIFDEALTADAVAQLAGAGRFDQRGAPFGRPAGGAVDIGAFEVQVAAPLPGDANDDGIVDLLDLDILGANFGRSPATFAEGDFNGDNVVDLLDLDILGQNWTATAPTFARGEAPLPGDANEDGVVDLLDLDIPGQSNSFDLRADFNSDGQVDLLDLDILSQNWGRRALLLLVDDEPTESGDAPTIAARDEALADEADTECSSSLSGRG